MLLNLTFLRLRWKFVNSALKVLRAGHTYNNNNYYYVLLNGLLVKKGGG